MNALATTAKFTGKVVVVTVYALFVIARALFKGVRVLFKGTKAETETACPGVMVRAHARAWPGANPAPALRAPGRVMVRAHARAWPGCK